MQTPAIPSMLAEDDGQQLTVFRPDESPDLKIVVGFALLGVLTLLTAVATLGVSLLIAIPALYAAWLTHRPAHLRFDAEGISIGRHRYGTPSALRLCGAPGGPCELIAENHTLLCIDLDEQPDWTPDSLLAVSRAAAARLGVPLRDLRPSEAWEQWAIDPAYRAVTRFDRRIAENRLEFSDHWGVMAARSAATDQSHHGQSVVVLRPRPFGGGGVSVDFTLDTLKCADHEIELASILRAAPVLRRAHETAPLRAKFQVLTDTDWIDLFSVEVRQVPGATTQILRWLGPEIEHLAKQARSRQRADRGNAVDVPSALRQMREG